MSVVVGKHFLDLSWADLLEVVMVLRVDAEFMVMVCWCWLLFWCSCVGVGVGGWQAFTESSLFLPPIFEQVHVVSSY